MKLKYREESRFFYYINYLSDLVVYNLLWILCCLPVITAGAATTALISVQLDLIEGSGASGARHFFMQFRRTFRRSTQAWLSVLLAGLFVFADFEIIMELPENFRSILLPVCISITIFFLFVGTYVFPIVSRKEVSLKEVLSLAVRMSVAYLPRTLLLAMIGAIPVMVVLFCPLMAIILLTPFWLLIGFSLLSNLTARILMRPLCG